MLSLLLIAPLGLPLLSPAPQDAPQLPHWIWSSAEPGDDEDAYFLLDLDVAEGLSSAKLEASCDNSIELFLNGAQLAVNGEWQVALSLEVGKRLQPGARNRIAINGWNQGGPAGLWFSLELEYEDGRRERVLSDDAWWVSREVPEGWTATDFEPEGWQRAVELAVLGDDPWGLPLGRTDGKPPRALEADQIEVPAGFTVELVYNVPRTTQGSWVSLATMPGGKLVASDQYGGLYLIAPSEVGAGEDGTLVEPIDVEIGAAQGLLWAFDALYVVGGTSGGDAAGLYRLTDSDGDGALDTTELLQALDGWGEHGPHAVVLSPDGESLYVIAGNHTDLPPLSSSRVPQIWGEDQLLPRLPDPRGHAVGVMAPGGWVCRVDPDGKQWELIACGMRNSYDMAFNLGGDLFTFDSDMEWDVGLPWYRSTRVLHLEDGADYGWRHGSGKWPASYPDSWPGVVDVGLGSPTGVAFAPLGWSAQLGDPWADYFLIADWAYGQVFAVQFGWQDGSYTGRVQPFLSGKPLPVTDLIVMQDELYLTTGGRRVQSGLYRVRSTQSEAEARVALSTAIEVKTAGMPSPGPLYNHFDLDQLWTQLSSTEPSQQRAARVELEQRPLADWQARAMIETDPRAALQAMIALARVAGAQEERATDLGSALHEQWLRLPFAQLNRMDKIAALRLHGLITIRLGEATDDIKRASIDRLDAEFPCLDDELDRELCRVLVSVDAPWIIERALTLQGRASTQEARIFYFYALHSATEGWTPELRETYFRGLQLAIRDFEGGASLTQYLQAMRDGASELLTQEQRIALSPYLVELAKPATPPSRLRNYVQSWTLGDFDLSAAALEGRDLERGRLLLDEATCLSCHRFAGGGGNTGPDFSGAGSRFNARDLLEAVLDPSAQISDQYQDSELITTDEELFVGRLEGEEEHGALVLLRTLPPQEELFEFDRDGIEVLRPHPLSRMPKGLLNTFERDEVLDLLAALIEGPAN